MKPSHIAKGKAHFCSIKCTTVWRKTAYAGEGNHQYGLKGSKNASWKSDSRETRYGYISIRVLDHPFRTKNDFVLEHRLVAEKYLLTEENSVTIDGKRYLRPDYVVHHKNFDRMDNRPENLAVMTNKEHQHLHNRLNRRERNEKGQFMKIQDGVRFKFVTETAVKPKMATKNAAGYDLCVDTDTQITLQPGEMYMFGTGIAVQMPPFFYAEVFSRSGISSRRGLVIATGVSVIDNDYRGEIRIPLRNLSNEPQTVEPHERVAQIVFVKANPIGLVEVDELDETDRGDGGFGSTGK